MAMPEGRCLIFITDAAEISLCSGRPLLWLFLSWQSLLPYDTHRPRPVCIQAHLIPALHYGRHFARHRYP